MQIEIVNLSPKFLEKEKITHSKLWNQTLTIKEAERIQIIAPSGSGKTSLMHFLYGLRKDYEGNILFDTKNLKAFTVEEFSAVRTLNSSIIFQDLRLFSSHSAFENINIKRLLQPFHGEEKITEMAARLGIENKLNNPVNICSYGEQQRIAIIRALQQPFDLLLMDEPFSNLDEANRIKAMKLIDEEVSARNAIVILADLKKIDFFTADRVIHL